MIKVVLPNGEIHWIDKSITEYLKGLGDFARETREILGADNIRISLGTNQDEGASDA